MRLTQNLLQEYIEAEIMIKTLEAKKQEVREAIFRARKIRVSSWKLF